MIQKIRKAVFPVGGLGTRFLPATKVVPKEMLTIVDRPAIQYAVDEARAAGIEHCVFVTGRNKHAIEDYFDVSFELEATLRDRSRAAALDALNRDMLPPGAISFTRQQAPLGLGHAVWCARDIIGEEPFAVLLPDVVTQGEPGCLAQMLQTHSKTGGNVIGVEECSPNEASQLGIVGIGEQISDVAFRITTMIEKPEPGRAPSNLHINGRYILQPQIFGHLSKHERGAGGEIQLTDALARLASEQPVYGHRFRGRSFDCGSKEGFIAANVAFAMNDPRLASIVEHEIRLNTGSQSRPGEDSNGGDSV